MGRILTPVNSRVIALIAAVNNSNPLVGNSLREEPEYDNLSHTHSSRCLISSLSLCLLLLQATSFVYYPPYTYGISVHVRTVVIKRDGEREREEKEQSTCCGSWLSLRRIPFSAAMIRLQSPSLPLCLSLYYTLTLFSLILKYTHFNHSLTRSPRRGLTPVCARVSLRSP